MPEVSGIIPIYNSARYFTQALNSVLGKTGKHIIDNVGDLSLLWQGSADGAFAGLELA
jgi:hypothetical protein